jgi:hypothetical protein
VTAEAGQELNHRLHRLHGFLRGTEENVSACGRVGALALSRLQTCFALTFLICAICEICGFKFRIRG